MGFQRQTLNKNENRKPDAQCPKCKSKADAFTSCCMIDFISYRCKSCNWSWVNDDKNDGWYDEEKNEMSQDDSKQVGAIPIHKSNSKWEWMPITKREAEDKYNSKG